MEPHTAYAMGRNSVWYEQGGQCPITDAGLARHWKDGRRDAIREEQLDRDTEWDAD